MAIAVLVSVRALAIAIITEKLEVALSVDTAAVGLLGSVLLRGIVQRGIG
jgi:hypothetical protein